MQNLPVTHPPEQSVGNDVVGRLLIFIVAYNAENTIEKVLQRIPVTLSERYDIEVLIIDDSSQDDTFRKSELIKRAGLIPFKLNVLYNPVNQGYGGNQKIGFHYAIENGFDWVALVHGDGQYAPECLPELVEVLANKKAEAVFGSRMLENKAALSGGMPLYKYVGNKVLTTYQNFMLGSALSEFHSGYRLYSISALQKIPFALNSNDFHFDTEIIIQLIFAKQTIYELPIPTFYGDEICHVNGMKYAWDVFKATLLAKVQPFHICYDPKYDCKIDEIKQSDIGDGDLFVEAILGMDLQDRSHVMLVGNVPDLLKNSLRERGHVVNVKSAKYFREHENEKHSLDYIFLLDDSVAQNPEEMVEKLKRISAYSPDLKICVTIANIGFILTRLLLLMGRFSYTRRGIINLNSFHFFTFRSARKMFVQNGFALHETIGLPVPCESVVSRGVVANTLTAVNKALIKVRKSLFSFRFVLVVSPPPSLPHLLSSAIEVSGVKSEQITGE